MAELELSRRKLVVLQLQRHGSVMDASDANAVNGVISTDKSSDKSMSWQDLKDAVDAAKVLVNCSQTNLQFSSDRCSLEVLSSLPSFNLRLIFYC